MISSRRLPPVWMIAAVLVAVAALVVGLVVLLGDDGSAAGGDSGARIVQAGAPGEGSTELTEDELEEIEGPSHGAADVRFMQGMIPHHQQALQMTALVDERSQNEDLALLARRIELSQKAEISMMRDWLVDRGEQGSGDHSHHGGGDPSDGGGVPAGALMPGMLTDAQLDRLKAARGAEFDRLFLEFMIQHHRGALVMVNQLRAQGGALETASHTVSAHIEADQEIEIARMQEMLREDF
jgi:uncharacterized protein (DUF305 family)